LLKHPARASGPKRTAHRARQRECETAESHLKEADKRVAQMPIEALWGNASNEARSILSAAASDSNNRVAANAVFGPLQA